MTLSQYHSPSVILTSDTRETNLAASVHKPVRYVVQTELFKAAFHWSRFYFSGRTTLSTPAAGGNSPEVEGFLLGSYVSHERERSPKPDPLHPAPLSHLVTCNLSAGEPGGA